jgi:hypothetical protein
VGREGRSGTACSVVQGYARQKAVRRQRKTRLVARTPRQITLSTESTPLQQRAAMTAMMGSNMQEQTM